MEQFEITNLNNLYIIKTIGPEIAIGRYRQLFIDFNINTSDQNPILVTDIGHKSINQVYFQDEEQAKAFLNSFSKGRRNNRDFTITKYRGPFKIGTFEKVNTKYGDCLRAKSLRKN